jgi:probable selenium-dependent hydroxylase accessory protein YqeC
MFYLLNGLRRCGRAAVAAATTRLSAERRQGHHFAAVQSLADAYAVVTKSQRLDELVTLIAGSDAACPDKLTGIAPGWIDKLAERFSETVFLVEGDGAAGKSLKGHLAHDPVIPLASRLVIAVIGIDCIGKTLTAKHVHRPERVGELLGIRPAAPITVETVAGLLFHPCGYLHNCPPGSRVLPFINKVESSEQRLQAEKLAELILSEHHSAVGGVMVGSVQQEDFSLISGLG